MRQLGLVGCGRWGGHVLRDLRDLGVDVHVVDPEASARARALDRGAVSAHAELAALGPVDGVVVAVPTVRHAAVVRALLPRAAPLYVEKPLTCDVAEAQELARAGEGRLFVMDKWRHHPGVEALAAIVRSGELGGLVSTSSVRLDWGCAQHDVDMVWALACHEVSIALELHGRVPPVVHAWIEQLGGRPVELRATLGRDVPHHVHVSTRAPSYRREVRVHGTAGVAVLEDPSAAHVIVAKGEGGRAVERRPIDTQLPLRRELAAFLAYLDSGPPPRSSAAEGAAVVACVQAMRDAGGL